MIAVIKHTFRELYRERIMYNVFFLSLFLIFVGYLASLLVYGHQDRVMLHFGTTVVSVSILAVSMAAGSRLLRSEIEQRNIYLFLSRPVSRPKYFVGKALGIATFALVNLLVLTAVLIAAIYFVEGPFKPVLFQWFGLTWVESLMVLGLSLALSFGVRPGLNMMIGLSFLFVCHNHEQMSLLSNDVESGKTIFKFLSYLTPDGSVFFLDTRIYYDQPLAWSEWFLRCGYGMLWAVAFLWLANAIFYRRDL
ncbi:MAG: ABC transporter permease subunit [Bdellovibrionales bacterium]|nr:ABC transporter permease subunit [Bdellovibrionales bacterium]